MRASLKKKLFREFAKRENFEGLSNVNMKYFYNAKKYIRKRYKITDRYFSFLLWCYDLEFFSIQHAVEEFHTFPTDVEMKFLYPMINEGLLKKFADRKELIKDYRYRMVEGKEYFQRNKYCITNKGFRIIEEFIKISNTGVTNNGVDIIRDYKTGEYVA
jgi:hypothetical protein